MTDLGIGELVETSVKVGVREGVEESIELGITKGGKAGIQQALGEGLEQYAKQVTPQMIESTLGYIPRQGFRSASGGLTKSGLSGSLDIGLRRMAKEGGVNGPSHALKQLAKLSDEAGLGLSPNQMVNMVSAALKVPALDKAIRSSAFDAMIRAMRSVDLGDDILNAAIRESTEGSLKALVLAPLRGIRNFSRALYTSFREGGLSPKNAYKSTKEVMGKVNRARLITYAGGGLAASILLGTGYLIWSGMSNVAPDPNEPDEDASGDDSVNTDPMVPETERSLMGQALFGLGAVAVGGLMLYVVVTMVGGKQSKQPAPASPTATPA